MKYIDITEKLEEFYHHLNASDVDRTIFSAKFGDGKTEFLHQFKEKYSNEYTFYTLYPVNYQIAPNEQIMEYIKHDLLFQLIQNGSFIPIDDIPDHILVQWYVYENSFDILKDIIKFAPSIIGSGNQFAAVLKGVTALVKGIEKKSKEFDDFKAGITEGNFEKAVKIIGNLSEGAGNIYELDLISWLIAQSIANKGGKSVLIIEDLDRIDPAHLFRILNIFSAHIDRHYLCSDKTINKDGKEKQFDELPNKFGFDKIIFVMDSDSTKAAFENFYGNSNYEGYINKFFSKRVFHYSIAAYAHELLYTHIEEKCGMNQRIFDWALNSIGVEIELKSVRDIAKVLDNFEDAYRKEKVSVTDDFCFLSDTPFVKLLATLGRLGVERIQMVELLDKVGDKYKEEQKEEEFIGLLGCFAMNTDSICQYKHIYYNGRLYRMIFSLDQDGYSIFRGAKYSSNNEALLRYASLTIKGYEILKKALKYVN
ncbi:hypothetical protein [Prevotella falsenii]|uniref:hypothetical protein n=1 Tax=Prevotella falsenii TaxID=515414 RepID=UPI0006880B99|nr:hypothetical protein [Prevotella falsenii]